MNVHDLLTFNHAYRLCGMESEQQELSFVWEFCDDGLSSTSKKEIIHYESYFR